MSATAHILTATTVVVGVGDLAVTRDPEVELVTYALGSCLGIVAWDPVAQVGGMLHAMLPSSSVLQGDADRRPERYIDTGVPLLFKACYQLGAVKQRMIVKVAGGASTTAADSFEIGKRNLLTLRKMFWKNGVLIEAQDTGGIGVSRTMGLHVGTGAVWLRAGSDRRSL